MGSRRAWSVRPQRASFSASTRSFFLPFLRWMLAGLATRHSWPSSSSSLLAQGEWVPASITNSEGANPAKRAPKCRLRSPDLSFFHETAPSIEDADLTELITQINTNRRCATLLHAGLTSLG